MSKDDFKRIRIHCGDTGACVILESSQLFGKYRLLRNKRAIAFSIYIVARWRPWYIFCPPDFIIIGNFTGNVVMHSWTGTSEIIREQMIHRRCAETNKRGTGMDELPREAISRFGDVPLQAKPPRHCTVRHCTLITTEMQDCYEIATHAEIGKRSWQIEMAGGVITWLTAQLQ